MQSLPDLQRALAAALMAPDATPPDCIIGACGMDAAAALAVYRNNVFTNYRKALRDDFPAILALVGEGFFQSACDAYAREHASQSGDLNRFGAAFMEFLKIWPPARSLAYLPDVARLEWAIHLAFNAAEAAPLQLESLAAVPPGLVPRLRWHLHPSAVLIESRYPVYAIWRISTLAPEGNEQVDLDAGPDRLLVVRRGASVEIEPLALAEWTALTALAAGGTLADVHADASAIDSAFDLSSFLQRHVAAQSIVAFEVPHDPNHAGRLI
jgi:hypothetical protein